MKNKNSFLSRPKSILFLLFLLNLMNYADRYIFSALSPAIKKDLNLTDTELGILGSAFIVSYLCVAPLFGYLGDNGSRSRLMAFGASLWSIATSWTGFAQSFSGQLLTRLFVGAGESSYTVISPGFLSDLFPQNQRGRVFAIYSGAISIGSALGFLLGGILEAHIGWKKSFFVVGLPGLFLALLVFKIKDPVKREVQNKMGFDKILKTTQELFSQKSYLLSVLGYAAYTFVVGGMSFWMPSYIVRYFDVSLEKANLSFGALTVVGGFLGTLIGGFWSDYLEKKKAHSYLKVSVFSLLLAVPIFIFLLQAQTYNAFCIILFFLELALFVSLSPIDAAVMSIVKPEMRSLAMAWDVFLIHFLGDGISRIMIGHFSDQSDLKSAIWICPAVLALAAIVWSWALRVIHEPKSS